jgi:type VI protein secretion system component VasF
VPDLIHRRSRGRFFGRKRLAERLPLEWISLAMLIVLAATYALLKLFFTD